MRYFAHIIQLEEVFDDYMSKRRTKNIYYGAKYYKSIVNRLSAQSREHVYSKCLNQQYHVHRYLRFSQIAEGTDVQRTASTHETTLPPKGPNIGKRIMARRAKTDTLLLPSIIGPTAPP